MGPACPGSLTTKIGKILAMLVMYDDVDVSLFVPGGSAYAGYVNGRYANISGVRAYAADQGAQVVDISVFASGDATCLDVEPGNATPAQAPGWVNRQFARGVQRPIVYSSAGWMDTVLRNLQNAGISRAQVRLWAAHYGSGRHICGPATCRMVSVACDGTQWTDRSHGRSLDESALADNFFRPPDPHPVLRLNDTGDAVVVLQQRLTVWGAKLVVDGVFGDKTLTAVKSFQSAHNLAVDGVVGPLTWAALLASPPAPKPPADWTFGAPTVQVLAAGHTSVKIAIGPPAADPARPDHYPVYFYKGTVCSGNTLVPTYPRETRVSPVQFGGLEQGVTYTVHVVAAGPKVNGKDTRVAPGVYASATFKTG